jgi:hypothetical protein
MKGIHIVYGDEDMRDYFERRNINWLDGRTPLYVLDLAEYDVTVIAEDPINSEDAMEALKKDGEEDENEDEAEES